VTSLRLLVSIVLILAASTQPVFSGNAYIELKTAKQTYRGKSVAHNKQTSWILKRDGQLQKVRLNQVQSFKKMTERFEYMSKSEIKSALIGEFGKGYEVAAAGHYVVCAPIGRSRQYAKIFQSVYGSFTRYFSTRGFQVKKPQFPLVAVVFASRKEFSENCKRDGIRNSPNLQGYYLLASNRVALFDSQAKTAATNNSTEFFLKPSQPVSFFARASQVDASLEDVIIHETTHQVAYNTGIHSRIGETPTWIVEGFATLFEADGVRNPSAGRSVSDRINLERFLRFGNFAQSRRKKGSLQRFIASNGLFGSVTLDAYAQAWALTFYLTETRSADFARYLKTVVTRDPLKSYSKQERLADFQSAFGKDLEWFDVQFLRYMSRLKLSQN